MTDDAAALSPAPICPWCSAELPAEPAETCRWCGATLTGTPDATVPGVTAIDAEAIVRAARTAEPQRRSRLLSWITGEDTGDDGAPAAPGSLEPPPPDVRREMLRLQLAARVADLQAEVGALAAEARDAGLEGEEQALAAVADDAAELESDVAASAGGDSQADQTHAPAPAEDEVSDARPG